MQVLFSCFVRITYFQDLNIQFEFYDSDFQDLSLWALPPRCFAGRIAFVQANEHGFDSVPFGISDSSGTLLDWSNMLVRNWWMHVNVPLHLNHLISSLQSILAQTSQPSSDQWTFPNVFRREMTGCKLQIRCVVIGGTKLRGKSAVFATTNGRNNNCGWDWLGMDGFWQTVMVQQEPAAVKQHCFPFLSLDSDYSECTWFYQMFNWYCSIFGSIIETITHILCWFEQLCWSCWSSDVRFYGSGILLHFSTGPSLAINIESFWILHTGATHFKMQYHDIIQYSVCF